MFSTFRLQTHVNVCVAELICLHVFQRFAIYESQLIIVLVFLVFIDSVSLNDQFPFLWHFPLLLYARESILMVTKQAQVHYKEKKIREIVNLFKPTDVFCWWVSVALANNVIPIDLSSSSKVFFFSNVVCYY